MSIHRYGQPVGAADKTDPASDDWMSKLPDVAWAWEFLRRDPDYPVVYSKYLLQPADPAQDARKAEVFWRKEICSSVLPVESVPASAAKFWQNLPLDGMRCHVAVIEAEETHHVLFCDEGRFLQLEVHGPCRPTCGMKIKSDSFAFAMRGPSA